jgi:hypothetical protein
MACSEDVYRLRKAFGSLKDATHHHMEDIMGYSTLMQRFGSGFFWPTMYDDTKDFIRRCGACQRHGNINSRDAMPLTNNLQVAVDYVSKWVEAMPFKNANA